MPSNDGPFGIPLGATSRITTVGYNAIGTTWETIVVNQEYMKSVTFTSDSLIASVGGYIQQVAQNTMSIGALVWQDVSGSPDQILAVNHMFGALTSGAFMAIGTTKPRWLHVPIGLAVTAGTYWIGLYVAANNASQAQLAYDSGSDKTSVAGFTGVADGASYALTTTARKYSIRAHIIS